MVIRATKNVKLDNGMESEGEGFLRLGRKASSELTTCVECWQRLGEGPPGLGNRWSKGCRGKKLSISERAETGRAWLERGEGPGQAQRKGTFFRLLARKTHPAELLLSRPLALLCRI